VLEHVVRHLYRIGERGPVTWRLAQGGLAFRRAKKACRAASQGVGEALSGSGTVLRRYACRRLVSTMTDRAGELAATTASASERGEAEQEFADRRLSSSPFDGSEHARLRELSEQGRREHVGIHPGVGVSPTFALQCPGAPLG
jgi:hypothetical protein